jgi:hypothetical protein
VPHRGGSSTWVCFLHTLPEDLRSRKSWLLIAAGLVVVVCVFFAAVAAIGMPRTLARVKVPGSNLEVVLTEDWKGFYVYDVFADGKRAAASASLGFFASPLAAPPQVAVLGDRVIVTFRTAGNQAPYLEIDLANCRLSERAGKTPPAPALGHCRRE